MAYYQRRLEYDLLPFLQKKLPFKCLLQHLDFPVINILRLTNTLSLAS